MTMSAYSRAVKHQYKTTIERELDRFLRRYSVAIQRAACQHQLVPDVLLGVLLVETVARGQWPVRAVERLMVTLAPHLVILLDVSIGPAQIKPSSLHTCLGEVPDKTLVRKLADAEGSIELCAAILARLWQRSRRIASNQRAVLQCTINQYFAGEIGPTSRESRVYCDLVRWVWLSGFLRSDCQGKDSFQPPGATSNSPTPPV